MATNTYKKKGNGLITAIIVFIVVIVLFKAGLFNKGKDTLVYAYGAFTGQHVAYSGYSEAIKKMCRNSEIDETKLKKIIANESAYSEKVLELGANHPEAIDFVVNYPEKIGKASKENIKIDISDMKEIPHFMQWDERWGYISYGDGIIGLQGCGPTCLSMVLVGLTKNTKYTPAYVAEFSENEGFYVANIGTSWSLMIDGAKKLGLSVRNIPLDKQFMTNELKDGKPIICSMGAGDFTTSGHFIVITGYKNGSYTVNDPNSKVTSAKEWSYETLSKQIRNAWSYSYEK